MVKTIEGPHDDLEEGKLFTAESFLAYMRKSAPHWWDGNNVETECAWVFRGQHKAKWGLIPTAAREFDYLPIFFQEILDRIDHKLTSEYELWSGLPEIWKTQYLRCVGHILCIHRFVKLSRELNFDLKEMPNMTLGGVISRLNVLQKTGPSDNPRIPMQLLGEIGFGFDFRLNDSVALAQHHGLPSFLLDWTENPINACHFATLENQPSQIAIWAMNVKRLQKDNELGPLKSMANDGFSPTDIIRPNKATNHYLSSQAGLMSYIEQPDKTWTNTKVYPDLVSCFKQFEPSLLRGKIDTHHWGSDLNKKYFFERLDRIERTNKPFLQKFVLPESEYYNLKKLLLREGISKAHMMPSLDNIAETASQYVISELDIN